jgi:hypothetical protein
VQQEDMAMDSITTLHNPVQQEKYCDLSLLNRIATSLTNLSLGGIVTEPLAIARDFFIQTKGIGLANITCAL